MNKKLVSLGVSVLLTVGASAQVITNTVSIGASYANQKWYSLANGEVGAAQSKDNWDIAFEITGYSSAILANTQKTGFALYNAPYKLADYATLDTAGISSWKTLQNSDTTWNVGAFNKGADLSDAFDLGWGVYDMSTHYVNGDSCFVIKLSATSYKKLKIVSLANGIYTFEYANINGTNSFTQTITKATYTGKNFVYADLTANTIIDREPVSSSWDLVFGRYTAMLMAPTLTPYAVVGIAQNKGVTVAQAENVANPSSYSNWSTESYKTNITTIGHDWKTVNMSTSAWNIVNDTVYFVKDKVGDIWKVRPISFGGSANGDFVFSKEKMGSFTGIANTKGTVVSEVMVYPNPSNGFNTTLLFSNKAAQNVSVSIIDMTGKVLSTEALQVSEGITTHALNTGELSPGIYFVTLNSGSYSSSQKLIIQ
ncbi:hypothetical protein CNR22_00245 [Sphingobacteriaceae bacterium]|nr:hypothetical protein CNR22_00245 [Sphingobacteriaceae bacterium]